ncbi:MAG: GPW/gp25 family protein [Dehalococcoidia bacterium]|nr:GPW/gp25 family protein [Dehalococcoidia bacterium]
MANENILIGRGWSFPLGVDTTGGLKLSQDQPEIEESITIILGTSPGERVMRPTFGCRIHELVFSPNTAETVGLARRYVEEALGMWEPRIDVNEVVVTLDAAEAERGRMNIGVRYTVRGTKDARSLVYPFYLIEPD